VEKPVAKGKRMVNRDVRSLRDDLNQFNPPVQRKIRARSSVPPTRVDHIEGLMHVTVE
jgi:hypothetical protein